MRRRPDRRRHAPGWLSAFVFHLAWLLIPLALAGCAAPVAEEESALGGGNPSQVVESFVEDLNEALLDPNLADAAVRQRWADRLASFFAPSERADQRDAMATMLDGFVASAQEPFVGEQVALTITYTRTELISQGEDEAVVRLVDGALVLRWLNARGEVLRERTGSLMEVIGETRGGLPVLRVGGQWFLTEG